MSGEVANNQNSGSGLAMAGFVISIIALVLSPIPIINNLAFILAVLSLIFGIVARKSPKAKATIIMSVVAMVVVIAVQFIFVKAVDEVGKEINKATEELNESLELSSGERSAQLLANDVSVDLGEFSVQEGEFTNDTSLPVKVTNRNAERKSYSILIEAVDASGARIAEDTVYANDLGSGQSQDFKAFEFVTSDKLEDMKSAQFRLVEVSQY